jgi:hypothetical protein
MDETLFDKMPELMSLLESRPFAGLSAAEQEKVLRHMSREEYEEMHGIIGQSRQRFATESRAFRPDPEIREQLLAALERRYTPRQSKGLRLREIVTFRVPVYQPVLAATLLFFLFFFLLHTPRETIRTIAVTDTVYVKQPVPAVQPAQNLPGKSAIANHESLKPQRVQPVQPRSARRTVATVSHDLYVENAYQKIRLFAPVSSGRSARSDSALVKLLVTVN